MELHPKVLEQYAASRHHTYRGIVCHAPFVSMNFDQTGGVRACCYNFTHLLGKWPHQSLLEIWRGEQARKLRQYIRENNLGGGCKECGKMIIAGNHQGVRARYYDEFMPDNFFTRLRYTANRLWGYLPYPRVMEFELSNECNLECVMCNGDFSSAIRRNREKRPPIISPYNDDFVNELDDFIPHLTDAKFLGGEPFMIEIYLKIWERILKIKPDIRIHITTNGTFLNKRIKELLEGLRAGIVVSIDSVQEETYKKIRINGNFQKVMENLEYFRDYTARKKTFISIAACPITLNWHELPDILRFCLEKNITLYFNAVFTPRELSLREQTPEFLENIIGVLEKHPLPDTTKNVPNSHKDSLNAYRDYINLLKGWLKERKREVALHRQRVVDVHEILRNDSVPILAGNPDELIADLMELSYEGYHDKEKEIQQQLMTLVSSADEKTLADLLKCYQRFYLLYNRLDPSQIDQEKANLFASLLYTHPKKDQILSLMCSMSPVETGGFIYQMTAEQLSENLQRYFA